MSRMYIEIRYRPIPGSQTECLSPAAALVGRFGRDSGVLELRLARQAGRLRCFLGVDTLDDAALAAAVLRDQRFVADVPSGISGRLETTVLLLRSVEPQIDAPTNQLHGSAPLKTTPIREEGLHLEVLYRILSRMEDGCGFSFFFRRLGPPDLKLTAQIRRSRYLDGTLAEQLCTEQDLYLFCGCIFGSGAQTRLLRAELRYACPALAQHEIPPVAVDADSIWKPEARLPVFAGDPGIAALRKTILHSELAALSDLSGLPQRYGVEFNPDTLFPLQQTDAGASGELLLGLGADGTEQRLPLSSLRRHMFLSGSPGAGKGNLIFSLAQQLHAHQIPFLLIESAKLEQHHLRRTIPGLKVWRPSGGGYLMNPFSLPPGVTMRDYRASLLQMLRVCFRLDGPLEELFSTTLTQCFAKYHYTEDSVLSDGVCLPFGLSEFMTEYNRLLTANGYAGDTRSNMRAAGITRLRKLFDQNPDVFDSAFSVPVSELARGENLLQLNSLLTMESKQLFATVLLISLGAWLRLTGTHQPGLRLVIILDESHNLLSGVRNANGDEYTFAADFQNLLLEMRSIGVGFVVADQSADNLPALIPDVCETKVFLGASRFSGIGRYAEPLQLGSEAMNRLYILRPGEGIWYTAGMSSGAFLRTEHVLARYDLSADYPPGNGYLQEHPELLLHTFQECSGCAGKSGCTCGSRQVARQCALQLMQRHKAALNQTLSQLYNASEHFSAEKLQAAEKRVDTAVCAIVTDVQRMADVHGLCVLQQFARIYGRECECRFDAAGRVLDYLDSLRRRLLHVWNKRMDRASSS